MKTKVPLTVREIRLLGAVYAAKEHEGEEWIPRSAIAAHLDKANLDSVDGALLDGLEVRGLIKSRRIERPQGVPYRLEYTIVDGE